METQTLKLDYSIKSAEERTNYIKSILPPNIKPNKKYSEVISNYICSAMTPEEKKSKTILTDNRMVTINKRETSYQGLVSKFENGEDGLYNLITEDKNIILTPKVSITQQDVEQIKPLQALKEGIAALERMVENASGKRKFLLKKQLIEMHQEQYTIKNNYKQPISSPQILKSISKIDLGETVAIDADGNPTSNCLISLFNPKHISALLSNYSALKEDTWGKFTSDAYYLMLDLDNLVEDTLADKFPIYYKLLIYKIDGRTNLEIQELLQDEFNTSYSIEYLSSLWKNKIPKMLAEKAKEKYLIWHYTYAERGAWKRCSRCGEIKLAHNLFFSKNNTSKDHFYSICKECRNKKTKEKKEGAI